MGGSAAESPTPPEAPPPLSGLRASDADRDEVAGRLREEFTAGRLSHDTFLQRMNAAFEARRRAELPPLLADLPSQWPSQPRTWSMAGWIRGVRARLSGSGAARPGREAGPGAVFPADRASHVVTAGLRAAPALPPPRPLEFPRGSADQFSIGRDASCDLAIADMTVSRLHATLERAEDGWRLTDLESTNGTRVNGWRVRGQVTVAPGDRVSFGNAEYALCQPGGRPPRPAEPSPV